MSYFEWTQNIQQFRWDLDTVNAEFGKTMTRAYGEVRDLAKKDDLTLRDAAMAIAGSRVAKAIELRGYV